MSHQISFFAPEERILASSGNAEMRYIPEVYAPEERARLFVLLRETIAWDATKMWMYDHEVTVPRLTAWYGVGDPMPLEIEAMRERMCKRFGAPFNAVGLNLYRNERDSVAWHSDKNEHLIANPSVAVLSLGAPREMQIRQKSPPRHTVSVSLEEGSVLMMRGAAQEHFEHCVHKSQAPIEGRISVVFRTKVDDTADK
ncbi:MAG: alpha-ketoglutarate-dependent dioxygenase AlkB [Candidatus Eremiobacteraeota bacterium]|nr:alpha-ketoglutarate-dependent dioxygenase AlkB [Candidatus Eremiobacteraeota bacterium]